MASNRKCSQLSKLWIRRAAKTVWLTGLDMVQDVGQKVDAPDGRTVSQPGSPPLGVGFS